MFELRLMTNQIEAVEVDEDQDLLSSIRAAGLDPICDCSGDGHCGRCKARIVGGEISPATDIEMKLLKPNELSCGWFLMCQRKPLGDMVIDMPQRNPVELDMEKQPIADEINPRVKKRAVDLTKLDKTGCADYQTLLLKHFADCGVKSVATKALEQLVPALKEGKGLITMVYSDRILGVEVGDTTAEHYGVAVDLGTAAIGIKLVDLTKQEIVGKIYSGSCQRSFGYNMERRVKYLQNHGDNCRSMYDVLILVLNRMIGLLCERAGVNPQSIYDVLVGGNPQFTHILFDIMPRQAAEMPVFLKLADKAAGEMGLWVNEVANVAAVPCADNEFGGDVAAICDVCGEDDTLIIDLGVDTKLIYNHGGMRECKRVETPVFEGMCMQQGMIAGEGAINGCYLNEETQSLAVNSQGYMSPCGVSGTGFWSLARDLKNLRYVTDDNKFSVENMPENVAKKVEDSPLGRQLVLAGGGFMKVLLAESDLQLLADTLNDMRAGVAEFIAGKNVQKVILTGAADMQVDLQAAREIGLLPSAIDWSIVEFTPQLALDGITEKLLHR